MSVYNPPQIPITGKTGTYTGDDGANRAIPHGLGVIPRLVIIGSTYAGAGANVRHGDCIPTGLNTNWSGTYTTDTAMTDENFYVSNGNCKFNSVTVDYYWVAFK